MKTQVKRDAPKNGSTGENPYLAIRRRLEEAEAARQASQLDQAQEICDGLLKDFPDYVAALHTLGLIYGDKGEFQRALTCFLKADSLAPDDWLTLSALSRTYLQLGQNATALRTLERARFVRPDDPKMLTTLGDLHREQREYTIAADMYRQALEIDPKRDAARFALGLCIYRLGAMPEAADVFTSLISDGIIYPKLLYALSQIPHVYTRTKILALVDRLERDKEADDPDKATVLSFAKATALYNMGEHREAWEEAVRANGAIRERMQTTSKTQRKIEQSFLNGLKGFKWPDDKGRAEPETAVKPLFVLGPSRCGKTTLERLVTTHPGIMRGGEWPLVEHATSAAFQAAALPTRDRLAELPSAFDAIFAEKFHEVLAQRGRDAQVLTNTHPAHIFSALRLAHVAPNARFVFVKRNRDDAAMRIFFTLYDAGNSYAYDLEDIRRHLDWYYAAIDAVASHLADRCLVVDYEQIVEAPDKVLDSVCALCGLKPRLAHFIELGDDRNCAAPYAEELSGSLLLEDG